MNLTAGNRPVIVVDLGTSKTSVLKATCEGEVLVDAQEHFFLPANLRINVKEVYAVPSQGMAEGKIRNVYKVADTLQKVVDSITQGESVSPPGIYLSVSGQYVSPVPQRKLIEVERRVITEETLRELDVRLRQTQGADEKEIAGHIFLHARVFQEAPSHRAEKTSSFGSPEPTIVYSLKELEGMVCQGVEVEYLEIRVDPLLIRLIQHIMERMSSRFRIRGLIYQPIASATAVLPYSLDWHQVRNSVIIDIGGGTTDIVVLHRGRVLGVHSISLGGTDVTQDLINRFHIPFETAEELKLTVAKLLQEFRKKRGSEADLPFWNQDITLNARGDRQKRNIRVRDVVDVIRSRYEEILRFSCRQIFAHRELRESRYEIVFIFTGGGAQWPLLEDELRALIQNFNRNALWSTPQDMIRVFWDDGSSRIASPDKYRELVGRIEGYVPAQFTTSVGMALRALAREGFQQSVPGVSEEFFSGEDSGGSPLERIRNSLADMVAGLFQRVRESFLPAPQDSNL